MADRNSDDICPHCGGRFERPPQRKTRCKLCGEFVFVKYRPTDSVRRLVTEARAFEIEREWTRHAEEQLVISNALSLGLEEDAVRAALLQHRDCTEAFRELCFAVMYSDTKPQTRRMAANLAAIHAAHGQADRLKLQRIARQFSLEHAIELSRFSETKLFELRTWEKTCASCSRMIGEGMNEADARRTQAPPDDCPRVASGALCGLSWEPIFE